MTEIILVRHGQTPWNRDKIFRGTVDVPLDDVGREEARLTGEWLKRDIIHAAYTSPLSRARDTARAICRHHRIEAKEHPGLTDLNFGGWQALPLSEIKLIYADLYKQWVTAPHTVKFPGGESLEEVRGRAWAVVEEVVENHRNQTVLLSAHRAVNKVLIAGFIGLDNSNFWRIGQDTTAINRFQLMGDCWHLTLINDTCHLRPMERGPYVDF